MPKLNILINGFGFKGGAAVLERALQDIPIRRCFLLNTFDPLPAIESDEPVRYVDPSAIRTVDWNTCRPIDEDLIERMRKDESIFMQILNRREGRGRILSWRERRLRYYEMLRYWNHFFEEFDINCFLTANLPHRDRAYLLYSLCRGKGIPLFFPRAIHITPTRLLMVRDWEEDSVKLRDRFLELQAQSATATTEDLPEDLRWYVKAQLGEGGDAVPWFKHLKKPSAKELWWKRVFEVLRNKPVQFLKKSYSFLLRSFSHRERTFRRMKREADALFRFYDRHALEPDYSNKFVYVPLHLQPEATSCPLGGAFADQLLMVQMLSHCLPDDVQIYIKENPRQRQAFPDGMGRDPWFYEELLEVRNVTLVPLATDTFQLGKECAAVAAVTGTAGLEGLFRGKPMIMFGHRFFQYALGVFPVHSLEDCKKAVQEIFEKGSTPKKEEVLLFMKALADVSIDGYNTVFMADRADGALRAKNAENLGSALNEELQYIVSSLT